MKDKINKTQSQPLLHSFLFEPNVYMCLLVSLKGSITVEEIEEATKKAYTQNETTMSKVILEEGKAYFQNMDETGCKVFVDSRPWREIMKDSEKKAFKINEGELFRTFILPEEKGYTLFMMVHHIAADGKAMVLVMEDILKNLAGKEVEYKPLSNDGSEVIPADRKGSCVIMSLIKYLNYRWKKSGKFFNWEDYYKIHEKFWETRESKVRFETLEKEELHQIKEECKEQGITVNSYMMAKILKKNPEYHNVCFPISLRKENRSISNRVIMVKTDFKYRVKQTFGENTKRLHKTARQYIENENKRYEIALRVRWMEPTLLDGGLMYSFCGYKNKVAKLIAELIGYVGKRKTHLTVTNLTNLEVEQDYGRFQVENMVAIAPTMSACENVICIGTFQGKMNIAYTKIA